MTQKNTVLIFILSFYFFLGLSNGTFPSATINIILCIYYCYMLATVSSHLIFPYLITRQISGQNTLWKRLARGENVRGSNPRSAEIISMQSRPAPTDTQLPVKRLPGFFPGISGWVVVLTIQLLLLLDYQWLGPLPSAPAQACDGVTLTFNQDEASHHIIFTNPLSLPLSLVQIISSRHFFETLPDLLHGNGPVCYPKS